MSQIKIIKPGKTLEPQLFECPECDCVFEASRFAYGLEDRGDEGIYYRCPCPHCLHKVYKSWEEAEKSRTKRVLLTLNLDASLCPTCDLIINRGRDDVDQPKNCPACGQRLYWWFGADLETIHGDLEVNEE